MHKPAALIYRTQLLASSEIFIMRQAEALTRFTPFYVGLASACQVDLPRERLIVLTKKAPSRISRLRANLSGPSTDQLQRLQQLQPALIHAHFGPDALTAAQFARALQIPLVITFHGYDATLSNIALLRQDWTLALYLARRKQLAKSASRVLAVSEFIRSTLISRGIAPEKVGVHYIGVDISFFCPDPCVPREKMILFVGRLVENKGCEYLLRSAAEVQAHEPEVKVVIIGEGHLKNSLLQLANELSLRNCEFLGAQRPEIVREYMNRARVFCVPSVQVASGASEGFGLVFAEAQSMGVPVVSFRTGGIPEAVKDGETGFLVEPRHKKDLADRIILLLNSNALWNRFSAAAREHVTSNFDLRKQTSKLETIYDSVMSAMPVTAPVEFRP